jgi:hypothetical protein
MMTADEATKATGSETGTRAERIAEARARLTEAHARLRAAAAEYESAVAGVYAAHSLKEAEE